MMKKWIPPVVLGVLVFAGMLYWLVSKRNGDDAAGVHSNVPSTPTDPDMVEEFGDGLDTEGVENTFEMSEEGKRARSRGQNPEGGDADESGIGQEMDGIPRDEDDPTAGLGGIDGGEGGEGGEGDGSASGVDTIDDDDGETLEPGKVNPVGQLPGPSLPLPESGPVGGGPGGPQVPPPEPKAP